MTGSLLFDISQFVRYPAASGIQRVLLQIATVCDDTDRFVVFADGEPLLLTPGKAEELIGSMFDRPSGAVSFVESARHLALGSVSEDELFSDDRCFVFPELSYDTNIVGRWVRFSAMHPDRVMAIFYDAIPEINRPMFGAQAPAGASTYFRMVARLNRVACISEEARRQLAVISHRPESDFEVAPPGADHLRRVVGEDERRVAVIGDLKAKKRVDVVIDAYEMVRDRLGVELVVVGRSIPGQQHIADRVAAAVSSSGVRWISEATDDQLVEILAGASVLVFAAGDEGYGLPALEALHAGVPLIAAGDLPALRYVSEGGQLRLDTISPNTVAEALVSACGPQQAALRAAARLVDVPRWQEFLDRVRETAFAPAVAR